MNEIAPIISVIVPVYNVEIYLNRCIDSIIKQTLTNIEIILVDDGSTDNSGKICDEFLQKDSRISVIHKKNGGLSSARNAGLNIAKGKYIGFVDSDDWIDKYYYEKLYNIAKKSKSDIVSCKFNKSSKYKENSYIKINENDFTIEDGKKFREIYLSSAMKGGSSWVPVWSKIYKRKIINDIRFEEGMIYEDIMFNWRVLNEKNVMISLMSYKGYYYYNNPNSITKEKFSDKMYDLYDVIDYVRKKTIDGNYKITKLLNDYEKRIGYSILIKMLRSKYQNKKEISKYYDITMANSHDLFNSNLSILRKVVLVMLVILPKNIVISL